MPRRDSIHFILTGGTIDSYYDATRDTPVPNAISVVPDFLKSLKLQDRLTFSQACMKDSRDLTRADQAKILRVVLNSRSKRIIILHGTYTMPDTARYLESKLKQNKKTILITGSMIPLVGFSPSDAPFNIGFAMAMVKHSPAGVYVAMNGQVFHPNEVVKMLREGRFVSIFGENTRKS